MNTVIGCIRSQTIAPYSKQGQIAHLWIGVSTNDQANGSWWAFTQDGVHFAQGCMAHVHGVHLQDLVTPAREGDIITHCGNSQIFKS